MRTIVALLICGSLWAAEHVIPVRATLTGDFRQNAEIFGVKWTGQVHRTDTTFVCRDAKGACRGSLVTDVFEAPQFLDIYAAGFNEGIPAFLTLERQSDKRRLLLGSRTEPGLDWRLRSWKLPADWTGRTVRLLVENPGTPGPYGWIAITLPMRDEVRLGYLFYRALGRVAWLWLIAVLLFVPGLGFALESLKRETFDARFVLALMVAMTGLSAYAGFWIYFRSPRAGKAYAITVLISGFLLVLRNLRGLPWRALAGPVIAFALISSAYCCFDFLYPTDDHQAMATERRFGGTLPPDNYLPEIVATRLYEGEDLRGQLLSGWHTSDRPPLQAAIANMARPIATSIKQDLAYELSGIVLQCTWVFAVWFLLDRLGFTKREIVPVVGMIFFSGFAFVHSIFVWPKLLAASYLLFGIGLLLPLENSRPIWGWLCIGLGLLSHSGCGLTLPGLVPFLWIYRQRIPWRKYCAGIILIGCLFIPWVWFQKIYDPPGDHLLRANFAGDRTVKGPLLQVIAAAYRKMTVREVLMRRASDFAVLFYRSTYSLQPTKLGRLISSFTSTSFFSLFIALGLLNLGFVFRCTPLWRNVKDRPRFVLIDRLLLCVALSTLIWIAIMYEESATLIHQGSLANVLLMMAGLTLYIQVIWPRAVYGLLAIQALFLFPLFLFSKRILEEQPGVLWNAWMDPAALTLGLASCCGLIWWGGRVAITLRFPPEPARMPPSP